MLVRKPKYFPWRIENSFKLLVNGEQFYACMLQAINRADNVILLETYFVESGNICSQFIGALIAASKRGVLVYVIFDSMGARGLNDNDKTILINSDVNLYFYHPVKISLLLNNFYRDHRKLLLVDNKVAFVGGAGISDYFTGKDYWRDNMLKIQGNVIKDWFKLFNYNWQKQNNTAIKQFDFTHDLNNKYNTLGKVSYSRGSFYNQIRNSLIKHIKKSKRRIWLASAYFVPSLKLRRALISAAKNGVEVKLVLPGIKTDNSMSRYIGHGYYAKLLQSKVRIFEYQAHFIHSKVVMVDDWVTIGSSNLDRWGANWNLEANQEIQDKDFALSIKQMFVNDFNNCNEITLAMWKQRSWQQKLKVWLWKYLGKIIAKIGLNNDE
jgi:phosphatidylserine/phosphatidylglycerophosphate/cardiolipin synthase-like enzyme